MVRTGNVDFSYNKTSAFSVGPPLRKISGSALAIPNNCVRENSL